METHNGGKKHSARDCSTTHFDSYYIPLWFRQQKSKKMQEQKMIKSGSESWRWELKEEWVSLVPNQVLSPYVRLIVFKWQGCVEEANCELFDVR